ncbi:hypothetical protein ABB37_06644 [Leptomonas pyrrhocoris]|uniref:Uncharacterized protein n=1 Tax=Leptomonas pyrrhocoris TaxID=157538 RepID=A0A0M9FX08_LEPPY|nr:hypothetical protein ABB37_06644 [Leptomonas pyrrhocoris]XP_015656270.1 hypothetical protein ABB37_06644 [Leptomonas pyrrhocoris]XP_015656271.1 hypothetical protein ABB37_06644 [Leptomonas pyrrhocoris]KPA77830.1 hypothetical protein ABB37_06644 [Leptomonas pyrrhocoris]KPA77831.1 hypothetical protein ABB37_06644 [Leptomonas pyrrhocoris]KPA77832.1 hypothetical protein ABB37_06644 [Leptomonas pyrrhocoris]|eukprot:XP_015656269.1 hypothetical protein ABB37_06644 [Leptomonas pyrrhocoris]
MSFKCCYRVLVCILLVGLTICTVISVVTPLYARTVTNSDSGTTILTLSLAKIDNVTTTAAGNVTKTSTRTRNLECDRAKSLYVASYALAIVAVVFGGVNVFFALVWTMAPCGFPLGAVVFSLTLLAFACSFVPFILTAYLVTHALCPDAMSTAIANSEEGTMNVKHGFILLLVSFAGLLLTFLIQVGGCMCGWQLERPTTADSRQTTVEDLYRVGTFTNRSGYQSSPMSTISVKK